MKRLMKPRAALAAIAVVGVCIAATPAPGAVQGRMSDKEWFARSKNKVVVLEYENPLGGDWGRQLADLTGRMVLSTMKGVDAFAVITLRQDAGQHQDLTPQAVEDLARKQRTPVVIWGEFYQQGKKLYVVSHLRYVEGASASARPLRISTDVGGAAGRVVGYASAPTAQANFAPVEISPADLAALAALWATSQALRAEPRDDAPPSGEIPKDTPYYLLETSGEWSRVEVRDGDKGWVRLNELSRYERFKSMAAAVQFAQGLTQYLDGNHRAAGATFGDYLKQFGPAQDPMNRAWAHTLAGFSVWLDDSAAAADRATRAAEQFGAAARLLPNAAAPVNAWALTVFERGRAGGVGGDEVKQLEKALVHAVQAENDADAAANLQLLYQMDDVAKHLGEGKSDFAQARAQRVSLLRKLEVQFRRKPLATREAAAGSSTTTTGPAAPTAR